MFADEPLVKWQQRAKDEIEQLRTTDVDQTFSVLNARARGATGDGSTDDSTAIQSALDAANTAGGGVVYLPQGTYVLGTKLTVYDSTRLIGDGWQTVLKMDDNAGYNGTSGVTELIWADTKTDVLIANMQLDGNKSNQTTPEFNHGIRLSDCSRVTISNIYAHDFGGNATAGEEGAGINIRGASDFDADTVISSCVLADNGGFGLGCYRAGRLVVQGCISYGNSSHGFSLSGDAATVRRNVLANVVSYDNAGVGINLEEQNHVIVSSAITYSNGTSQSPGAGVRLQEGKRIVIDGLISASDRWGILCETGTTGEPADVVIKGAIIITPDNAGMRIRAGSGGSAVKYSISDFQILTPTTDGILVEAATDVVNISNGVIVSAGDRGIEITEAEAANVSNVVIRSPTSHGIDITSGVNEALVEGCQVSGGSASGMRLQCSDRIAAANNICNNNSTVGINISSSTAQATVTGNQCSNNGQHGISLNSISDEVGATVTGNHCRANSTSSADTYAGILINGCEFVAVTGNTCVDDDISATGTQGYGIRETGTCDYNTYVGNVLRGNSTADLSESGSNNKSAHNVGSATHDT